MPIVIDKTGVLCSYEFKIVHMDLELFNTVTYVIETTPGFHTKGYGTVGVVTADKVRPLPLPPSKYL